MKINLILGRYRVFNKKSRDFCTVTLIRQLLQAVIESCNSFLCEEIKKSLRVEEPYAPGLQNWAADAEQRHQYDGPGVV